MTSSLYLPSMTSQTSLPSVALQSTAVTTGGDEDSAQYAEDHLLSSVSSFWSSFPCPPPWNPAILLEVNSSKLGPKLTNVVTNFLAGKCQLSTPYLDPRFGNDGVKPFRPNAESHLPENAADLTWCDRTCQLAIGCTGVVMAMIIATVALVCFTRVRRPHKMASARPSRQQLQLSSSTSDAVNWAEFSNTQIQFDDDNMIYPPFRHRGLPNPPAQCHHPSCDPKWNCPMCSSCHPLMRMSPSCGTSYGRGPYTAVYETIDDDEEDASTVNGTLSNRPPKYPANGFLHERPDGSAMDAPTPCQNFCHSFSPRKTSTPPNDLSRSTDHHREAETGFNGEETPAWQNYFELDQSYDQALVNQLPPLSRNTPSMKSFQSPHQQDNKWGFHSILAPSTFGRSPSASQMSSCNQLCATCVPNVVSMAPCVNISRPNGYIPNGKVLNVNPNPYAQTIMCVENNSHAFDPSSSYPDRNVFETNNFHGEAESTFDETPLDNRHFIHQGCDFSRRARSDQSLTFCQIPPASRRGHSLEEAHPDPTSSRWHVAPVINGDHRTHETDAMASPSHAWCPTCNQVPLVDHLTDHRHNVYDGEEGSEARARNRVSWDVMTSDGCYRHSDEYPDSRRATYNDDQSCTDSDFKGLGESSTAETLHNSNDSGLPSETPLSLVQRPWLPSSSTEAIAANELDRIKNDNSGDFTRDCGDPCPRVLALHSSYFDKTSTA